MTLKEKIENILCNWIDKDYNREFVAKQIEIDVNDYAIEFAEWFIRSGVQFYDNKSIGNVYTYIGDLEVHTSKELLEIFKKEKGL